MSYFLPSFVQKRILRYALSRLELLETNALDLESLDIAWGKKSTIVLRNVGLQIKRLSSLLRLPRNLHLTHARVLLLRISIPADIYKSGIVIEVEGVDVRLKTSSGEDSNSLKAGSKSRKRGFAKGVKANRPRSIRPIVHDPGGFPGQAQSNKPVDEDSRADQLPTTVDLAQSFLQTEPLQEKAELQSAIARSQYLHQFTDANDNGPEDFDTGVGAAPSLPGFLAGFLKGVGDRLQIRVKDVEIRLEVEMSLEESIGGEGLEIPKSLAIHILVESVDIQGVTNSHNTVKEPESRTESQDSDDATPIDELHRHITLKSLRGKIVADVGFFNYFSRFPTPPSPEAFHGKDRRNVQPRKDPASGSSSGSSSVGLGMARSTILRHDDSTTRKELNPKVLDVLNIDGKARNARSDLVRDEATASTSSSMTTESLQTEDNMLNSPTRKENFHTDFDAYTVQDSADLASTAPHLIKKMPSNRRDSQSRSQDAKTPSITESPYSSFVSAQSDNDSVSPRILKMPHISKDRLPSSRTNPSTAEPRSVVIRSPPTPPDLPSLSDQDSSPGGSSPYSEDLAQSRVYSHEEARSMYLSAMSHSAPHERVTDNIPGIWNHSSPTDSESTDNLQSEHPMCSSADEVQVISENTEPSETLLLGQQPQQSIKRSEISPIQGDIARENPSNSPLDTGLPQSSMYKDASQETTSPQATQSPSTENDDPLRIEKHFFELDSLVLRIPQGGQAMHAERQDTDIRFRSADESAHHDVPGAFSQGASSLLAASGPQTLPKQSHLDQTTDRGQGDDSSADRKSLPINIAIGAATIYSDIGLARVFLKVIQQLQDSLSTVDGVGTKQASSPRGSSSKTVIKIAQISWKLVETLRGVAAMSQIGSSRASSPQFPAAVGADVLLVSNIRGLEAQYQKSTTSSRLSMSICKMTAGYTSDNIISFDSSLKMRESTRDILGDKDFTMTLNRSSKEFKVQLSTLPIHVTLDLRRLDETFSWFGGFSSILGLGSSMASTITAGELKSRPPATQKRSQGVHFDIRDQGPKSQGGLHYTRKKVTVRIGGFVLDLQGKSSRVRLETTAIKFVDRVEGIGLQIDKLRFSGPHFNEIEDEASVSANLGNIRMEYLTVPKEDDLARLLALLSPSKDQYDEDDDILLDTLLRQRRQGGVVRFTIESLKGYMSNPAHLEYFPELAEELGKLSTVTKYLPEDDRPGLLILGRVSELVLSVETRTNFGDLDLTSAQVEFAHVSFPTLSAVGVRKLRINRNGREELLGEVLPLAELCEDDLPMIMARMVGDELEPTIKIKLWNIRAEYRIPTIMAMMGLPEPDAAEMVADMVSSIAKLTKPEKREQSSPRFSSQASSTSDRSSSRSKSIKIDVSVRNSVVGLNPRASQARGLLVLTNTNFCGSMPKEGEAKAKLDVRKASVMVIDDVKNLLHEAFSPKHANVLGNTDFAEALSRIGYVSVSYISAASAIFQVVKSSTSGDRSIDIEVRDELFVLETCADSTQTLNTILNGLKPPLPQSKETKYRTEIVPVQDMLASLSGDAFTTEGLADDASDEYYMGVESSEPEEDSMKREDDKNDDNLSFVGSYYNPDPELSSEMLEDSMLEEDFVPSTVAQANSTNVGNLLLQSFEEQHKDEAEQEPLDFRDDHFGVKSSIGGTARKWDPKNTYGWPHEPKLRQSPLRIRVRDVHFIWNLFDGYDWQHTRDTISQAVANVETQALEKQSRKDKRKSLDPDEDEESVIGDFLFNSIYIGIPANRDPRDLARQVNRDLDDLTSEAESHTTSTISASPSQQVQNAAKRRKKLRLNRSKHHKMTFELKGVSVDLVAYPPNSGETQSSTDVRIRDLEIFDHVPTSTWKKFATYMHDAGERESNANMVHLEILNVRPVPDLAASEIIIKLAVLPLRLHVDQDALDFMTRFFEFKDDSTQKSTSKSEAAFIQRAEVESIRVRLDFKPKRVDYAGLRSGHTTEFMNLFILDQADMVLRHVIIYGVCGFDKLGKTLNNIWMPDVKRNQLPGVLAGLAPVRSLVNVGGGFKDLIVIPMREYRKDGRVVRSLQKGALAFAKTTTSELVKLGAKLAIGTQTVLQGAEDFLGQPTQPRSDVAGGWEDAELDEEEKKQISLYADQPIGVVQGLKGAYASLERDLLTAKDAIVAMPGEVMESGTAGAAARAVMRGAPTIILRPAMGVSKAVGQTLMGATNSLDPGHRKRVADKYKRH